MEVGSQPQRQTVSSKTIQKTNVGRSDVARPLRLVIMRKRGYAGLYLKCRKYIKYPIELVNGRLIGSNIVLRGCTLGLLGHPFNIDLMPIELGSFDVIIDMDCGKKKKSKLSIISCTKTQKYIKKGCQIFLAQVTKKETEDKSEEKRLEDVPIIRDFPEVFPEDLPDYHRLDKLNSKST
ncbi:hypothetical protein Tco_0417278 [Tanacetum coccineum]